MKRIVVYPGEIPTDAMFLSTNQNTMVGSGFLAQALLGTATLVDGLACTPTTPASLSVLVGPGSIYAQESLEATSYGSLPADTTDQIVKQGIILGNTTFSCPAPTTSGQSRVYLVQAQYADVDGGSTVLPYYNASNPSVPYSGPSNSGVAQNTIRDGVCVLSLKTGVAATTGSQVTPTPDAGYTGLWAITVANGATTITSGNIAAAPGAPFIGTKLTGKLNAASNLSDVASAAASLANLGGAPNATTVKSVSTQQFTSSGTYTPSAGMLYCVVEMVGGGGGSGGCALTSSTQATASAGGGGSIYARSRLTAAQIGTSKAVTVAAGGTAGAAGANNGGNGGTSSLGSLVSATGGLGGTGGIAVGSGLVAFNAANSVGGSLTGTGDILITGGTSGSGYVWNLISAGFNAGALGGAGGSSYFGMGQPAANNVGNNYGGGASGVTNLQNSVAITGFAGAPGLVIITEYCNQ